MAIDPRRAVRRMNPWFVRTIEHKGHGRAEFSSPAGVIEGPAAVQVNDAGTVTIRLEARELKQNADAVSGSISQFLFGVTPGERAGPLMVKLFERNICEKVTVTTDEGEYVAPGDPYFGRHEPGESGAEADLTFRPLTAEYVTGLSGEPRYWVLPLSNLVCDFERSGYQGFDVHPLRLRQAPALGPDLPEQEGQSALRLYRATSPLIAFEHGGRPALIEPLLEYENLTQDLLAGARRRAVTSVAVGELAGEIPAMAALDSWTPLRLPLLLTLATGSKVGIPWIEVRGDDGRLLNRLHVRFRCAAFVAETRGRANVRELGLLLTRALSVPALSDPAIWIATRHMVESHDPDASIEEMLSHVCRGVEALANRVLSEEPVSPRRRARTPSLLKQLSECGRDRVRRIIRQAVEEIEAGAANAQTRGAAQEAESLAAIASKLNSDPPYALANFGRIVLGLLRHYGFHDDQAIERAWEGGLSKWVALANEARNVPMHGGYFDVATGEHEDRLMIGVAYHLCDILLRGLLRELQYDGPYQPTGTVPSARWPLDWVKPDTRLDLLGYH